jgi:uncharacterized membrane protein YccC
MLRNVLLLLLLVAILAGALVVEAVWGYAIAAVVAVVVLGIFVTGDAWPDDRPKRS